MDKTFLYKTVKQCAVVSVVCFLILSMSIEIAFAKSRKIQFISDIETDQTLKFLAQDILRNAQLNPDLIRFHLIKDNNINAFVAGGMDMYINTGLIEKTENVGELIGVIAHEIGHISGGHVIKGYEAMDKALKRGMFASLLGLGAGLAAKDPSAAVGSALFAQNIAQRSFLSFSRAQEASADQAALKYLSKSNLSAAGLESFFDKLSQQEFLPPERQDEFIRTHPLSQDRIDSVHFFNENSSLRDTPYPAEFIKRFNRLKVKFMGYFHAGKALKIYKDQKTLDEKYGYAYALAQRKRTKEALKIVETLLDAEPKNPFFHEFKAQLLFDDSQIEASTHAYLKAIEYLPNSYHLRMDLSHALLETNKIENWRLAKKHLKKAAQMNAELPSLWQLMATAFGKCNEMPEMYFALAKQFQLQEDLGTSKQYLEKAIQGMSKQSPYYIQLQDLKFQIGSDSKEHK